VVFSSISFLFLFLPVAVIGYVVADRLGAALRLRWLRNLVLLGFSVLFYTWGSGPLVGLLAVSIVVDYVAAMVVDRGRRGGRAVLVRLGLAMSILVNVGLLAYFKYANFAVAEATRGVTALGLEPPTWMRDWVAVTLPIGISFYTFQSMSYTIDVAQGRVRRLQNLLDFALYVTLFPQLIAGPIVRFHEVHEQLGGRRTTIDQAASGATRFAHGLIKKVVVADTVAVMADAAFAADPGSLSMAAAWLGVLAYTVQIYFDFSGYSDMAIGLGMVFGFRFPENFRRPYSALSVTDFWRRWHITLSNWFRDYVYIPLGGNRVGSGRTYANLVAVFVITGIWHGASWTFVVWGLYHGMLLLAERLTGQRPLDGTDRSGLERAARRLGVLVAVMVGWVLFRSPDLDHAVDYLGAMAGFGTRSVAIEPGMIPSAAESVPLTIRHAVALGVGMGSMLLPSSLVVGRWLAEATTVPRPLSLAAAGATGAAFLYSLIVVASGQFSPFLYFQF
jgi:alginate O-acetyltransferase complex protein AlgI